MKKFAFGEDGAPFEVDVVVAFNQWVQIDDSFRPEEEDSAGLRMIPSDRMPDYHRAAVDFVQRLAIDPAKHVGGMQPLNITTAEALDFIARLREQYDELAAFFRPRSREERASPDTSATAPALRFQAEPS